jgi:hypothetical protein
MREYHIPQPPRVRRIEKSFAWIDHRLLRNGFLQVMTHQDQALYLFLALAADRHGVSFYRKEKICHVLGLDFAPFEIARDRLIGLKLIAFQPYSALSPNGFYQVLPVDEHSPDLPGEVWKALGSSKSSKRRLEDTNRARPAAGMSAVAWARG